MHPSIQLLRCLSSSKIIINTVALHIYHIQVNGAISLPENVADNGGLHASFQVSYYQYYCVVNYELIRSLHHWLHL